MLIIRVKGIKYLYAKLYLFLYLSVDFLVCLKEACPVDAKRDKYSKSISTLIVLVPNSEI